MDLNSTEASCNWNESAKLSLTKLKFSSKMLLTHTGSCVQHGTPHLPSALVSRQLQCVYQIDTSYASIDELHRNDPTVAGNSIKRGHRSYARFCGAVKKKKSNAKGQNRESYLTTQEDEGNQRGSKGEPRVPGYYPRDRASREGREALRVRGREITSVVCGFSYVPEVTIVDPGAIPVHSTRGVECLSLSLAFSLSSQTRQREEKQEEDEQEERGGFCSHLERARSATFSRFPSPLSPFLCLSLCFTSSSLHS